MRPIRAYWWSPLRSPRALASEVRHRPQAWLRNPGHGATRFTNYGDELTALLVESVTGRRVRWAPLGHADVVAVGSVLAQYLARGGPELVWGSGLHAPVDLTPETRRAVRERVLAVRGHRTRDHLGLGADTPLGDPALLLRVLTPPRRPRRDAPVLVPHFSDLASPAGRLVCGEFRRAGYHVADPSLHPRAMVALVSRASHVVTAGMHGLILAHALGAPVLVTHLDGTGERSRWKYHDYLAAVGRPFRSTPASTILTDDRARAALLEEARAATPTVLARVDGLVDDLLDAAEPLRTV